MKFYYQYSFTNCFHNIKNTLFSVHIKEIDSFLERKSIASNLNLNLDSTELAQLEVILWVEKRKYFHTNIHQFQVFWINKQFLTFWQYFLTILTWSEELDVHLDTFWHHLLPPWESNLYHLSRCWKISLLSERIAFVIFRVVERIQPFRCRKDSLWISIFGSPCHLSRCWKNRLVPLDRLCHLSRCRKNSSFALSKEFIFCSCQKDRLVIFCVVERITLFLWIAFVIFRIVERIHLLRCRKKPLSSFALSKESPCSFGSPLSSFALLKESPCSFGSPLSSFALLKEFTIFRVVERIHLLRCQKNRLAPLDRLVIFRVVERIALFLWIAFVIFRVVERIHLLRCQKNRLCSFGLPCHLSRCWKNRLVPLDRLCHLSRCRKNSSFVLLKESALLLWIAFCVSKESSFALSKEFIFCVVKRIALLLWIALSSFALLKESPCSFGSPLLSFALSKEFIFLCIVERIHLLRCRKSRLILFQKKVVLFAIQLTISVSRSG